MNREKYLNLLAQQYPNHRKVKTEIVNLKAIQALPKGSEFFLSDIHGEFDAFEYFVRSGSGIIREKIDVAFGDTLTEEERYSLASLIYDPDAELARRKKSEDDYIAWSRTAISRLIVIARVAANKYTRSKVRKILPDNTGYIMDELMYADDVEEREQYYQEIIDSVVEYKSTDTLIREFTDVISECTVDHLHIIGDLFDRGPKSHEILDYLMTKRDIDIQWGNHDILWMGAACGNRACIANMIRINVRYNNFDMLEYGYGFNLRPLATMAEQIYGVDPCEFFQPNTLDKNRFDPIPEELAAKMHKMIAICQFKCEGQEILKHPEYHLDNRNLIDKIDFENGTVNIAGVDYPMRDMNLPTIDPDDPFTLTPEEEEVMVALEASIIKSEKLQTHVRFLFSHGAMYKVYNGNVFYHGSIPFNEDGSFKAVEIDGDMHKGADIFRKYDEVVRSIYFDNPEGEKRADAAALIWYLWLGPDSPLFGKDQMTTFERLFIADKATHKEHTVPYYKLINREDICEKILEDFGLDSDKGKILNGHVPVKIKDGESPIKGNGKLFVIDGGISKAYHKTTGIAGYTFIFTSGRMVLAEHHAYEQIDEDGNQTFHKPVMHEVENFEDKRIRVRDTDQGKIIEQQISDLNELYKEMVNGTIKEVYPPKGKYYSK